MNIKQAYNSWSEQYDTNINRTRDLEKKAIQETLSGFSFESVLEIGCGTGKNTVWFIEKAAKVTAIDLSEQMLAKAERKICSPKVRFRQADITGEWDFANELYDLVSFSLVLEHIEDLDHVFRQASAALKPGGFLYLGELHPFKQYSGTKARFDTVEGRQIVDCFNHNLSDFIQAASHHSLVLQSLNEYFDNDDRTTIPRILTMVFKKL